MLLFTVVYDNEYEEIIEGLNAIKENFALKNIILGISESIVSNTHFIKIFCSDEEYNSTILNKFNMQMANILYNIAVKEFYMKELGEFLVDTYFFLKSDELKIISKKSMNVLQNDIISCDENMIYCVNRKNAATKKIIKVLEENREINIKGFITFRMKELREDLEGIIDKVVERYMVEKEYNEFIKLLKYFVEIQESKIEELNIIIQKDGSYLIKDKQGVDMMQYLFSDVGDGRLSGTATVEDLIISSLITNAPEKIIIHSVCNCNNKELIDTIKGVFGGKVEFCDECEICNALNHSLKV